VPTLVVIRKALTNNAGPQDAARAMANARLMVRRLYDAGAPLLAGTDAGVPVVEPGTSLHEELAELIAAGLSPYDALAAATVNPARFLGLEGKVGVVKVGARADLLLLKGNPLEEMGTVRSPVGVVLRGRMVVPERSP
jgi:imidazolonepropionase-like amidohydrolase